MFLDTVLRRNRPLIDYSIAMHQRGLIEPDTFVVDMDVLIENAKLIINAANKHSIGLYFMLKQLGRNPLIAKRLMELGYQGAVVVDFREAQVMMNNHIPIGNVGHLVQPPFGQLEQLIKYGVEVFTVYSLDKLKEINETAKCLHKVQDVLVKVSTSDDVIYSGQQSGIDLKELKSWLSEAKKLTNIRIVGATAFPCYLYDSTKNAIDTTANYHTVMAATSILEQEGCTIKQINVPSTTCVSTLELIAKGQATMGEPGHGLTGTTPAHAFNDLEERPAVIYLSEISHNFKGKSYAYGGGHYRRSHVSKAIVSNGIQESIDTVQPVSNDSIDYYFELSTPHDVSRAVIMAFRFQIFVTRSNVVLVEGIQSNQPKILGVYTSLGQQK